MKTKLSDKKGASHLLGEETGPMIQDGDFWSIISCRHETGIFGGGGLQTQDYRSGSLKTKTTDQAPCKKKIKSHVVGKLAEVSFYVMKGGEEICRGTHTLQK